MLNDRWMATIRIRTANKKREATPALGPLAQPHRKAGRLTGCCDPEKDGSCTGQFGDIQRSRTHMHSEVISIRGYLCRFHV